MKYGSEILAIVEGGLEGDAKKVRAYTELLVTKIPHGDHMQRALQRRLDGTYKNDPVLEAKQTIYHCSRCQHRHRSDSKLGKAHMDKK